MIALLKAKYAGYYKILCEFNDGTKGIADLAELLWGPVFTPLKDKKKFAEFQVHPVFKTIVWSNGADIAPEKLYDLASQGGYKLPGGKQHMALELKEKKTDYRHNKKRK